MEKPKGLVLQHLSGSRKCLGRNQCKLVLIKGVMDKDVMYGCRNTKITLLSLLLFDYTGGASMRGRAREKRTTLWR